MLTICKTHSQKDTQCEHLRPSTDWHWLSCYYRQIATLGRQSTGHNHVWLTVMERATKARRGGGGTGSLSPLPSSSSLSSLEGRTEREMIKRWKPLKVQGTGCPFIYFKTIMLGSTCTLLQTTNLCFLQQKVGRSEEVVARLTPA